METYSVLHIALPAEKATTNIPLLAGDLLPILEIAVLSDLWLQLSVMGATHKPAEAS